MLEGQCTEEEWLGVPGDREPVLQAWLWSW